MTNKCAIENNIIRSGDIPVKAEKYETYLSPIASDLAVLFLKPKKRLIVMPKKDDVLDIFKPKYLNLYHLTGYVKAHLSDLLNGKTSERGKEWGKAWITELIQRLAEIKKELRRGPINTRLSWALATALRKTAIESGFIVEQGWQTFSQGNSIINKIRCSFQSLLKNHPQANKRAQRLKLFCEILCQEMPYEERFVPGPVVLEIKIPPSSRTNWMADGQPGEAD